MNYRRLGRTNLMVSEIGLGAQRLERHNAQERIGWGGCKTRCPFDVEMARRMEQASKLLD